MAGHGSKKRKRETAQPHKDEVDTSKPTAVFEPSAGRKYTLSIALPGSIIANAQSHDHNTTLAGQIARALAVFCADEVVVFDDGQGKQPNGYDPSIESSNGNGGNSYTGYSDPNHFLLHLLSYLETPAHLRKHLFPMHPNLRTAGTLPSLDMPHHLRAHEWCQYREGVTIEGHSAQSDGLAETQGKKQKGRKGSSNIPTAKTLVDAGLPYPVSVPASIPLNSRVTLKFSTVEPPSDLRTTTQTAEVVAPSAPREETGYYWGYNVRSASSLSAVLTECPFDGGYDATFGTSERGIPLRTLHAVVRERANPEGFRHMLIVFGGVAGLEAAVKADEELAGLGVKSPEQLFDFWVNLCEGQGSRTIRTEEAVWLGLMGLKEVVLEFSAGDSHVTGLNKPVASQD